MGRWHVICTRKALVMTENDELAALRKKVAAHEREITRIRKQADREIAHVRQQAQRQVARVQKEADKWKATSDVLGKAIASLPQNPGGDCDAADEYSPTRKQRATSKE